MNKQIAWMWLVTAAIFEVGWVVGLKHAGNKVEWALTFVAIAISFLLLIRTGRVLPVGTAYAVFVGLGTVGTVAADLVIFQEPVKGSVLVFILVLLVGVIGLKVTTDCDQEKECG